MKILWDLKILWKRSPEGPKFCEILSHSVRYGMYVYTVVQTYLFEYLGYNKCPKNFVHEHFWQNVYANSADPDQTAPKEAVWPGSTLLTILLSILKSSLIRVYIVNHSTKYFKKQSNQGLHC